MVELWVPPSHGLGEKAIVDAAEVLPQSVQSAPRTDVGSGAYWLWSLMARADAITPWGRNTKYRDRQLREFLPTEGGLISADSIASARNAALSWKLTGDEATIEAAAEMMNNANFGGGWEQFIIQVSHDLYTQDEGAFVEWVREDPNRADSPVVGIAHLDTGRCYQTGNPEYPVVYEDINGERHRMPWHNVVHLLEMPAAIVPQWGGPFYRIQYSAVTRALEAARVLRSITRYKDEKVSGRYLRALHIMSGVSEATVQDAIARAQLTADNQGTTHYIQPAIVGGVDPNTPIKHEQVDLASLPDGWDEESSYRIYIMVLAMAWLTDYQEFAPLPGGNLGTSAQSEVLHMKSKGKGPGLFQKLITRMMNGGALPANVRFEYDEPDLQTRELEDKNAQTRAETRKTRIESGEIDVEAARQLAFEEGDLPEAVFDELVKREEARALNAATPPEPPREEGMVEGEGGQSTSSDQIEGEDNNAEAAPAQRGTRSFTALDDGYDEEEYGLYRAISSGVPFGHLLTSRLHRAYSDVSDDTHAAGYFRDTEERKVVAGAIGPALAILEDALREAGIYEITISPEDADRIASASMHLMGSRAVTGDPPSPADQDRLDYEAEVGAQIAVGLGKVRRIIRERLIAAGAAP